MLGRALHGWAAVGRAHPFYGGEVIRSVGLAVIRRDDNMFLFSVRQLLDDRGLRSGDRKLGAVELRR